ncbi:MAG: hypothetical protein MJY91_08950 [Bacteroidales bacterium]|nr:hypothetical protein [Bacteroidales bacterium]
MEINFKKVHTLKDLAISTIVLLVGIGLFFVNKGLGITIAVCGLAMFLLYKGGYKKDGQGIVLQKKSEDLCKACKSSVVDYLNGKDVTPQIKKGNEGGSVRLDVYHNAAAGIAYAQLFDFRNYAYEPETDVIELHSPKVDKLISLL